MIPECPFKNDCAFYRLFGAEPRDGLRMIVDTYCLAPKGYQQCWRLAYRQDNGASPPPYLAPSGHPFQSLR
ncbi:hypothetical protein [Desulfocurvibacter africanus]|uniref:hypothetical protein n=1 Tax=Desulfocurvibacter africanus TaxID=873 RepID=UPI00041AE354|nr:hypothetical protein [Desulfocurvibacter africanus]